MSARSIEAEAAALLETLTYDNRSFSARFAGAFDRRQPVHTVYGGAHLFRSDLASRMGLRALESLEAYAPDAEAFADVIGVSTKKGLADKVYERVRAKLERGSRRIDVGYLLLARVANGRAAEVWTVPLDPAALVDFWMDA